MKTRYKPALSLATDVQNALLELPIDRPVAVYYRQSTTPQIGNISTAIQTIDLPALLHQRGWSEDRIVLVDMDAGVSGQLRIDQREGMRYIFDLITAGKIGAVCSAGVDADMMKAYYI